MARLGRDAFARSIRETLSRVAGRDVSVSTVFVTLTPLEDQGLLISRRGAAPERGGRATRIFRELVGELDREFAGLAEPRRTGWRGQLRWAARVASPDTLAFVWRTRRRKGEVGRMAGMLHDFRLAVRGLVREARASAFIVMTLALGIGSVTAIYGVAERLFLSGPRHVRAPEELVRVLLSFENERIAGRTAPWVPWLTAARSPMARLPSRGSRSTGATSGWGASEASRARSR